MAARDIEVLDSAGFAITLSGAYLDKIPLDYKRFVVVMGATRSAIVWITKPENRYQGTATALLELPNRELVAVGLNAPTVGKFDKNDRGKRIVVERICEAARVTL